eukprot:6463680-Amphidinium_carterae.1
MSESGAHGEGVAEVTAPTFEPPAVAQPDGGVSAHSLFRDAANIAGVREEVLSAFEAELGAPSGVTLGALLELPRADIEAAMSACQVDEQAIRALEKGALRAAISWAARQLGRPAPSWGGVSPAFPREPASSVNVKPQPAPPVARKRKLSHILDQGSELEIEVLQEDVVRR